MQGCNSALDKGVLWSEVWIQNTNYENTGPISDGVRPKVWKTWGTAIRQDLVCRNVCNVDCLRSRTLEFWPGVRVQWRLATACFWISGCHSRGHRGFCPDSDALQLCRSH